MPLDTNAWLMITGAVLGLVGLLIRWRTARYDLKDAAIDSAWTLARGKRSADNPTAIEAKIRDIAAAPTLTGKATRTAAPVAGHFIAQVLAIVALVMVLAGAVLLALGYFWR
jgi:hypothetical protein